jgi:catalase-peroxidase
MRVLNANAGQTRHGVFTKRPEALTNDFFANLLDMGTAWAPVSKEADVFEGRDRKTGELKWTARASILSLDPTRCFGPWRKSMDVRTDRRSSSRTLSRLGNKVMNLDRFDLT